MSEASDFSALLGAGDAYMEKRNIVVTLSQAVQIGHDEWKQHRVSRVFSTRRSIHDLLSWAENEGITNPQISDLHLSEYTGESA